MSEKNQMPQAGLNPRHPDIVTGALTTELPRQPRWSQILATKETSITRHLLLGLSDWELLLLVVKTCSSDQML